MKKQKKIIQTAFLSLSIFYCLSFNPVSAESNSFQDVSHTFWGYSSIQWALENKIIDGYPDGTFKPNQLVTNNEFIVMLIRAYQPSDLKPNISDTSDWSTPYIKYWSQLGWNSDKNVALSRGQVAKYLANATGKNYSIVDSVQYLLDKGLAEGKTSKSIDGFMQVDPVTRAEAVTFIQRLKKYNNKLQSKAVVPTIEYKISKHNLTINLPKTWEGNFDVENVTFEDSTDSFHFFDKDNRKYGGLLFTLTFWPKDKWEAESDELVGVIKISKVGEHGGEVLTISFPSDVNFSLDDLKLREHYDSMYEDIKNQRVTFKFNL